MVQSPWGRTSPVRQDQTWRCRSLRAGRYSFRLTTYNLPPGIKPRKLKQPLTQDKAESLARAVVLRLFPGTNATSDLRLLKSGLNFRRAYYFDWQDARARTGQALGQSARVEIRRADGLVDHVQFLPSLPEPKVSIEAMSKIGRESLPKFMPKYLDLRRVYHVGQGRLLWHYAVPPSESKGLESDVCRWDANTGELLYSEAFNGGTREKPFRNPSFYTAENEEVFRRNIAEAIKARLAELEKNGKS